MKITMVGATGTGKTCYMLGMYAQMSMGIKGFSLTASDPDDDLKLWRFWDTLVDTGVYPPSNDANIYEYNFDFNYGGKSLASFNWIDYRGAAFASTESSEADVSHLWEAFKGSNCLFVCVSGEFLKEPLGENSAKMAQIGRKIAINRFNKVITDLHAKVNPSNDNPFPVVLVLTKYDYCMNRDPLEVQKEIRSLFNNLFLENSGWLTMICPVSLGKGLVDIKDQGDIGNHIDPINIHYPVCFAIYTYLYGMAKNKLNRINAVSNQYEADNNWWNQIFNSDDLQSKRELLQASGQELERMTSSMSVVLSEMNKKDLPIFLGDKKADISKL